MFPRACKTHGNKYDTRAMTIEQQVDRQLQYRSRNCLLIHGIEERRQGVTDELFIQTIKAEINIDINLKDIDWTHQVGAKPENEH